MIKILSITLLIIFLMCSFACAQGFEREYKDLSTWGSEKHLVKNRDGSFAFCAISVDSTNYKNTLTLVKLYPNGNVQWTRSIYSDTFQLGGRISIDTLSDWNYIVAISAQYSYNSNNTNAFIALSKIDSSGTILWNKRITLYPGLTGQSNMSYCDVRSDPSGGFGLVWGDYTTWTSSRLNFQKFSNNGILLWQKSYAANFNSIQLQHSYSGGWLISGTRGWYKGFNVLRTDSLGNVTDNMTVGLNSGTHLIEMRDSSVIVVCDNGIARIDKNHQPIWAFNPPLNIGRMILLNDSTIELLGMLSGYVIKQYLNANNGNLLDKEIYTKYNSPPYYLYGFDLETTNDGGSLFTYQVNSIHLVKTDSLGKTGCEQTDEFSSSFQFYHYPTNVYINYYPYPSVVQNYYITPTTLHSRPEYYTEVNSCCTANLEILTDFYGICAGSTVTISAQGMPSYIWSNGVSDTSISVTVNSDTMFTVSGSNTCVSRIDTINLHPNANPVISLITSDDTICYGAQVQLSAYGTYNNISWNFPAGYPVNDTVLTHPQTTGYYIATGGIYYGMYSGSCITKDSVFIVVDTLPMIPVLSRSNDTLFSSAPVSNQWYISGVAITGATNNYYKILSNGNYSVTVTNTKGCSSSSAECNCMLIGIDELFATSVSIYPNPASDNIYINTKENNFRIELMDVYGRQMLDGSHVQTNEFQIDISKLSTGIYFLKFISDKGIAVKTFSKQ